MTLLRYCQAPTRRALRDGDLDSLPRLYKRRLVGGASDEVMSGSGIPGNVSSPRTPLPSSNVSAMMTSGKPVPPKKIMFSKRCNIQIPK